MAMNELRSHLRDVCVKHYGVATWELVNAAFQSRPQPYVAWGNPLFPRLAFPGTVVQCGALSGTVLRLPVRPPRRQGRQANKPFILLGLPSALPILAMGMQRGGRYKVLDMCAGPGGKTVLTGWHSPFSHVTANEILCQRRWRMQHTLADYLRNGQYSISSLDGVHFGRLCPGQFDRVLLDAPCTNDRHLFHNLPTPEQVRRLEDDASDVQRLLLGSALSACRPGGVVVYCTCTLDLAQNDRVVDSVLRLPGHTPATVEHTALPEFAHRHLNIIPTQYGYQVIPTPHSNWGPFYLCTLRRHPELPTWQPPRT